MSNHRFYFSSVIAALALTAGSAAAAPVSIPEGVSDALPGQGTGLCSRTALSSAPNTDFVLSDPAGYNAHVNTYLNMKNDNESVIRTLFDLSNNNTAGGMNPLSYGDFKNSMLPDCQIGGCDFYNNNGPQAFGERFRGYFNVTSDLANKAIHFGFYTDDSVSLTFFGKSGVQYPVVTRAPVIGAPTWRLTEQVTFQKPGLYPVEILYVEITESAALEMSFFIGAYTDFEREATNAPVLRLNDEGFQLFPPTSFFQTLSGNPSFPDLAVCQQCDRAFVNQSGNNGCLPGYYCNDAALCAPCDTAALCGPMCSPCGGQTPFCVNINGELTCGGCRTDADCTGGFTCDPITRTCNECNDDSDCPKGETCDGRDCQPCATSDSCAGASCNCCPKGQFGDQMKCAPIEPMGQPLCVECTSDAECRGAICNLAVGRCMNALPENNTPVCCGDTCVNCLALDSIVINGMQVPRFPFCLPGPVGTACAECRQDTDCGDGGFCLSGVCKPCTKDKRCGLRCDSCGGDTPYCKGQTAATAECVRCIDNTQCGAGTCDTTTGTCSNDVGCLVTCDMLKPICEGSQCVECFADSHCPCGGTCNLETRTCSPDCKTNIDCLGNDHCRWNEGETAKECALGPMPDGVECGGTLATLCSAQPGRHGSGAPAAAILVGSALALLRRRQRRGSP
ncbi:MAG TPA: outer membrane exchange protein TraA family protein [Polyangium sp.]|nr:outer membrane exchange protein TraA family protein [Polyangium sp.]